MRQGNKLLILAPATIANTVLPLCLTGMLAMGMAELVGGKRSLSQRRLACIIATTALVTLLFGAGMLAFLYELPSGRLWQLALTHPIATLWFFTGHSAFLAAFWGPLLALVWFIKAHEIERRRGELIAQVGRSDN